MNKTDFKELVVSFQEFASLSQKGKGKLSTEFIKQNFDFEKHLAVFSAIDRYCYVVADVTQLKLVKAGGSFLQMTGYEPSEFENKLYNKLLKVHSLRDLIRGALGGSKYYKYLYSQPPENRYFIKANRTVDIKCKNGTKLHCLAQSIPIAFNDKMEPIFFLNILSDLSQIKPDNSYSHYIVDASNEEKIITIPIQFNKKIHANSNSILSLAEIRVLKLLAKGNSSKQIADSLFISEHTVKNHRKSMLKKYECNSSAELVKHALKDGII
jgi:DNA-binding CsgD family transcriptional regulator